MGDSKAAFEMRDLFIEALDKEGLKYRKDNDDAIVSLPYSGDNFDSLSFRFIFSDTGGNVRIVIYSIVKFKENQLPDAYEFCNEMNAKWRWLKFYVDSDNELTAEDDAVITTESCGAECLELLHRSVSIIDEVCGTLKS